MFYIVIMIFFVSLIVLPMSLIGMLFRAKRAKAKTVFTASLLLACLSVFGLFFVEFPADQEARAAGFDDSLDRKRAAEAGVATARDWSKIKEREALARGEKAAAEKIAAREAEEARERGAAIAKRVEEEACRSDLQCIGRQLQGAAAAFCSPEIERLAKYQHEWTDGFMDMKFSHYRWADKPGGNVTLIGDKIKFQNGFGAWQYSIYECDMNPATERPLAVRASPGRL